MSRVTNVTFTPLQSSGDVKLKKVNEKILKKINKRITLKLSPFSSFSYSVMRDCWKQDPDERPSFQQLLDTMEHVVLQEVSYFDLSKLDESKDYYAVQESRAEGTGCSENTFL